MIQQQPQQDNQEENQQIKNLQDSGPFTITYTSSTNSEFNELDYLINKSFDNKLLGAGFTTSDTIFILGIQDKPSQPLVKVKEGICTMISSQQIDQKIASIVYLNSPEGSYFIEAEEINVQGTDVPETADKKKKKDVDKQKKAIISLKTGFQKKWCCFTSSTPNNDFQIISKNGKVLVNAHFYISKGVFNLGVFPQEVADEKEKILIKIVCLGFLHKKIQYIQNKSQEK